MNDYDHLCLSECFQLNDLTNRERETKPHCLPAPQTGNKSLEIALGKIEVSSAGLPGLVSAATWPTATAEA